MSHLMLKVTSFGCLLITVYTTGWERSLRWQLALIVLAFLLYFSYRKKNSRHSCLNKLPFYSVLSENDEMVGLSLLLVLVPAPRVFLRVFGLPLC